MTPRTVKGERGARKPGGQTDGEVDVRDLMLQLRETQHLLEESRDRYADLYDYAPIGYVTMAGNGRIREGNITFARMVGYDHTALHGIPFNIFVAPEDLNLFFTHMEECGSGGERVTTELRLKCRTGHLIHVQLSSIPVADYESRSMLFRTAVIDVTDRKRAEAELQNAKDELEIRVEERTKDLASAFDDLHQQTEERLAAVEDLRRNEQILLQQNRLAAMGEMIGNIAHQWRQPLNILGLLFQDIAILSGDGELTDADVKEKTAKAMQVIAHMSKTIDDFRNFFRPDYEKSVFRLKDSVESAVSLMGAALKAQRIAVDIEGDENLSVSGYANQFSQVVLNILMNARDALQERQVKDPRVLMRLFLEKGRVVVTIADNAGGIPEEIIGRIFDPYFTTKGHERGTGIGLFMARTIIERNMHGRLKVRNTASGAEFTIEIPASTCPKDRAKT